MDLNKMILDKGIKKGWIADKIGISKPLLSMYLSGVRTMPEDKERKIKELLK